MNKPQTIRTAGGETLVVLSQSEYDDLVTRAGPTEAEEEAGIARIVEEVEGARARGWLIPLEVVEAMANGENPIRAIRRWRGRTQTQLAAAAGLTRSHLSALERGDRAGTADTLKSIADALNVPVDVLVD
jgi:DNA-binding XRE family transcriptional regulator